MEIVVQKFGGTSVSKEESRERCLFHVKNELNKGHKVVVVISAMGRKGDPYATDTLLSLLGQQANYLSKKDLDLFLSTGELISSSIFSNLLHENGINNTILTGGQAGIITNDDYTNAKIISLDSSRLLEHLKDYDVVVIPGFQGVTQNGYTTTLGRGGSDTTATAIGVEINAKYVDIFTDVEGIMTADPRLVTNAKILNRVTYNETLNLANLGAKVIHPRAVEMAMTENIPIRVRSTFSDSAGTLITHQSELDNAGKLQTVTGVTQTDNLIQVIINKEPYEDVFQYFSDKQLSIDFIQTTPTSVSFTLSSSLKDEALSVLQDKPHKIHIRDGVAKVSIVGAGIYGIPGVMSKCTSALYQNKIDVLQSSDSHTTIWFLVNQDRMQEAVQILHDIFI
ncbi:aspartate kinase [Priestia megaterium]|nr:aspartate kinase [Priestia megaterium]